MHESNEHSPLTGETWGDASMQEKRGISRALALLVPLLPSFLPGSLIGGKLKLFKFLDVRWF
jgi:hypothetical protein